MVEYIENLSEYNSIISQNQLVVIEFTATWCGPCKQIAPVFETLCQNNPHCIFRKVDVDECDDICDKFNISSMPTFQFFKNNKLLTQFSGANIKQLQEDFKKYNV